MPLLHAAKKYKLSILTNRCTEFLDNELKPSNACEILDQCERFGELDMEKSCLEIIEQNTTEALATDEFMNISNVTLGIVLDSDKLSMDEVDIFEKACEWASEKTDETHSIRDILGENIYKMRFPVMTIKEFNDRICSTDVLSESEQLHIFKYMANPENSPKPEEFCCEPRIPEPITGRIINKLHKGVGIQ